MTGISVCHESEKTNGLAQAEDGVTPLALTNGAAPRAAWNRRGMWTRCTFRVGGDCREYSYNLLAAINQKKLPSY